ncbi:MAG: hypothetical protein ACLRT4_12835 [Thomasclavelia sp.]
MSFNINMTNSNFQNGNNNTFKQSNVGNLENINWDKIEKELDKITGLNQSDELVKAAKIKSPSLFKANLKQYISDYGINVLSDLSTAAILEILKLFLH